MTPRALKFEGGRLLLLDQRRLPGTVAWVACRDAGEVTRAIRDLVVRGAPAIGIAAAYGLALAGASGQLEPVREAAATLDRARPTAVNLHWAVRRMSACAQRLAESGGDLPGGLLAEASAIHREDELSCRKIGDHGLGLLSPSPRILTHCNAGALATGGIGTALAPVYLAHQQGREVRVFCCESRPVMQGARLTTWELREAGIDVTLLVDAAAAHLLSTGAVEAVWIGADRIAANGDVANKVGSLSLACAAQRYGVPFYVAAPRSTFDPATASGREIPVEFRPSGELQEGFRRAVTARDISYWTPAFDIVPAALITAYVSEEGVVPAAADK